MWGKCQGYIRARRKKDLLKTLGIVALILVCTATGFYLSVRLRRRKERLAAFCELIGKISDGIRIGQSLPEIFSREGKALDITIENEKTHFPTDYLYAEDKQLLFDFFSHLGLSDTPSQIKRCSAYHSLLLKHLRSAEKDASEKAPLYSKLGFFAGLFISVLVV